MGRKYIFIGISFLAILIGCKEKEGVIAKVGKSVLTEKQFYSYIPPEYTATITLSQKKQLVEMWINTELFYQEALKQKLHKGEKMKTRLYEMKRQLLANEFLESELAKIGSVDEFELRNHFDNNKDRYNTERKVAEIAVNTEEEAKKIIEKLNRGEKFSNLAKTYSIAPSAKDGGVIGYLRVGDLQFPDIEDVVFSLEKVGDVSKPIAAKYGYVIVKLLGVKKVSDEVAYENMKERIRTTLNSIKQKAAMDSLFTSLKEVYKVEEKYELLGIK